MKIISFSNTLLVTTCLYGCIIGGTGTPQITATGNRCTNLIGTSSCTINLTYNTGGVTGLSLGVKYDPQQFAQFTIQNLTTCPAPSGGSQTCSLTVNYKSTGVRVSQNMIFTLGSANSSPAIQLSGS